MRSTSSVAEERCWPTTSGNSCGKSASDLLSRHLLPILLICLLAAVTQPADCVICNVDDAYDLSYAFSDAADCHVLELQNNVALTPYSFFASGIVVNNRNLTIQSVKIETQAVLDFGSYSLSGKVLVTGLSNIIFRNITLKNYLATPVQNGILNTFLPLFHVQDTSRLYISNVNFRVKCCWLLGRLQLCSRAGNPRTSW